MGFPPTRRVRRFLLPTAVCYQPLGKTFPSRLLGAFEIEVIGASGTNKVIRKTISIQTTTYASALRTCADKRVGIPGKCKVKVRGSHRQLSRGDGHIDHPIVALPTRGGRAHSCVVTSVLRSGQSGQRNHSKQSNWKNSHVSHWFPHKPHTLVLYTRHLTPLSNEFTCGALKGGDGLL